MNYDNILSKIFYKNNKLNYSNQQKFLIQYRKHNKYVNIYNYLLTRYNDSSSISETLYRIKNNIEIRPVCKLCGKPVKFVGKGNKTFREYCSNYCVRHSKEVVNKRVNTIKNFSDEKLNTINNKRKNTCLKKYGTEYYLSSDDLKEKSKQTCLQKYGTEYYLSSEDLKEKSKQYNLLHYGCSYYQSTNEYKEKVANTKINKYGNSSYINIEKIKETNKLKYGVEWSFQSDDVKNKIWESLKKHKSYNKSKPEDICYKLLKEKYPDIIRQYYSDKYPFKCDFYIPSKDLYLEYNGFFHQKHFFNKNDINDIKHLNELKEKANKSNAHLLGKQSRYDTAIYVWTDLDVRKQQCVKQNKLNFVAFWNVDECKEWIKQQK